MIDLDRWAETSLDPTSLPAADRQAAARLQDPVASLRLLARRSATRAVLAGGLGGDPATLVIERRCPTCGSDQHGRPSLGPGDPGYRADPPDRIHPEFSVSSSDGTAVVAVSTRPVGVDLEVERPTVAPLPVALTPNERLRVGALGPDQAGPAFLRLWTAKEAVLKASGRSLADDPATVEVGGLLDHDVAVVVDGTGTWTVRHLALEDPAGQRVILAVADGGGGGGPLSWRWLSPEGAPPSG